MRLFYLATGPRDYLNHPVTPYVRRAWEFQAVLEGQIAPTFPETAASKFRSRTLWCFPPGVSHGWTGDGNLSRVAVFHFLSAPETFTRMQKGTSSVSLSDEDCAKLVAHQKKLDGEISKPTFKGDLISSQVLFDLCLMVLGDRPNRPLLSGSAMKRSVAQSALIWYSERLAESPNFEDVAAAVRYSPSQLRRIFQEVYQASPGKVLEDLRLKRAIELLKQTTLTQNEIAEASGYSEASSLARTLKARHGKGPGAYRSG